MNMRQRVEESLPPRLQFHFVSLFYQHTPSPELEAILDTFAQDCVQKLAGLPAHDQQKAARRITRTAEALTADFMYRRMTVPFLAVKYLVDWLVAADYVHLSPQYESAWARLAERILADEKNRTDLDAEPVEKAALKNARKLLARLQFEGLYRDVEVTVADVA